MTFSYNCTSTFIDSIETIAYVEMVEDHTVEGLVVFEVVTPGQQGGGSGTAAYVYQQLTPATTWTINHNLGYRPSVELLDSGSQEIDGAVSHPTVNQTVVTLSPATAGLARLI
jgi:hypothetical protein